MKLEYLFLRQSTVKMRVKYFLFLIVALSVFIKTSIGQSKYEFRGVWVASVNNIDWPSKPGLTSAQQQKEVVDILEVNRDLGMNAVILQVRPAADAFYPSELEPWSRYLTGTPGKAPEPFYDPLQFWIEECHKRGMEFHAWLNPYRVAQNADELLAGNHIAFQHPEWILEYGNKLYFDPGIPDTRLFVVQVVKDIISRYDVDAIHFDDYFYPYPTAEEFPDSTTFTHYNRGFSPENKADWRRENVDILIKMLNDSIKAVKPWVKFGISPFGVWRNKADDPKGSDTRGGATNYDHLYADVIKWQEMGWIDYLLPQIYWQIGHRTVDFEILANWWKDHGYNRSMYIGQAVYKIDKNSTVEEWSLPGEIPGQIRLLRTIPEIEGSAFYSSKHFNRDLLGLQDSLENNLFLYHAIVPPMNWIDSIPPNPVEKIKKRGKKVKWKAEQAENEMDKTNRFLIYINEQGKTLNTEDPGSFTLHVGGDKHKFERINKKRKKYEVRVSTLDRLNNESEISKAVLVKL